MLRSILLGFFLLYKARLFLFIFWLLVALIFVGIVGGQFSGRQPATVVLDLGISFLKYTLPVLAVLLVQELFSKEFDKRFYLYSFTYPVSRSIFLVSRFLVVFICLLMVLFVGGFILAAITNFTALSYLQSRPPNTALLYIMTLFFLAIDLFSVVVVAVFFAIFAKTPSFVLVGTFGYLLIARSYSSVISLLNQGGQLVSNTEQYQGAISVLRFFVPDLGGLDVRSIALYNSIELLPLGWGLSFAGCLIYSLAVLAFSLWLFERKRLS